MKNDSTLFKADEDLGLDSTFDPLEDFTPENEDDTEEFSGGYLGTREDAVVPEEVIDDRPAEVRIDELFANMAPRRKVLLSILDYCAQPQPVASVNTLVDELQENNFSVYTAASLCALLEKAGALERLTSEGDAADELENEPQIVVVDGVEYLEAAPPIEINWLTTEAGKAACEADKPLDRLMTLLEEDALYKPIYKRMLTLCLEENGATAQSLGDAIDKDALVQKPRLYAPHFFDKLEKCDALTWDKAWFTTDIGKVGLETLADINDAPAQ